MNFDRDNNDPWTFFGEFTKIDIENACLALAQKGISFKVTDDLNWQPGGGWGGPHCLWVDDDDAERAAVVLIPLFANGSRESFLFDRGDSAIPGQPTAWSHGYSKEVGMRDLPR
jgi:hypothetical protein